MESMKENIAHCTGLRKWEEILSCVQCADSENLPQTPHQP